MAPVVVLLLVAAAALLLVIAVRGRSAGRAPGPFEGPLCNAGTEPAPPGGPVAAGTPTAAGAPMAVGAPAPAAPFYRPPSAAARRRRNTGASHFTGPRANPNTGVGGRIQSVR